MSPSPPLPPRSPIASPATDHTVHVYRVPSKRSDGYCFKPVPISFDNVDWFTVPGDPDERALRRRLDRFIRSKRYYWHAPYGTRFLVLCDGPGLTFQIVKATDPTATAGPAPGPAPAA